VAEGLPRRAREAQRRSRELKEYALEVIEATRELEAATGDDVEEFRRRFFQRFSTTGEELMEQANELERLGDEIEMIEVEVAIEGSKIRAEALKHQATISAGAIAGIATITQIILPPDLNATLLLWTTYAVLLLTVCISVSLMHVEARRVERALVTGENPYARFWENIYGASTLGLPAAVLLYIVFFLFNGLA